MATVEVEPRNEVRGRPRGAVKVHPVQILLSPDQFRELSEIAAEESIPMAAVVRRATLRDLKARRRNKAA